MSLGKQHFSPPVFPAAAPTMIPGAEAADHVGAPSISLGWMLAALVAILLAGAGMFVADSSSADSQGSLAWVIAAFSMGLLACGAALHQAFGELRPAVRPRPAPTTSAAAEVVQVHQAHGLMFGTATVRFTDAHGALRESKLVQGLPMSVGQPLTVKYHPDHSDWVLVDAAGPGLFTPGGPEILGYLPLGMVAAGALLLALCPFL